MRVLIIYLYHTSKVNIIHSFIHSFSCTYSNNSREIIYLFIDFSVTPHYTMRNNKSDFVIHTRTAVRPPV